MSETLSPDETEALNRHGVFFKKRALAALGQISGLDIITEELGVSFGGTRVIDIIAQVTFPGSARLEAALIFVIECKRVDPNEKRWLFFSDNGGGHRVLRLQSKRLRHGSAFGSRDHESVPICSEGYEFTKGKASADQNPVFMAASQLAAGYLGFIQRRHNEFAGVGGEQIEKYIPVLLTTAQLAVVSSDTKPIDLLTGRVDTPPDVKACDYLILKHPFPTPEGLGDDFRDFQGSVTPRGRWDQLHKESIYVVNIGALGSFFSEGQFENMRQRDGEAWG
jgi:hypothetical protein